jgi:phosphatidylserine decarboxylase
MRFYWVKESLPFFTVCAALLLLGWLLGGPAKSGVRLELGWGLFGLGLGLTVVGMVFFRDPERSSSEARGKIIAPADGRVAAVEEVVEANYFQGPAKRVAIFMHLGNVHVQRLPADARLVWTRHQAGKYRPAFLPEAAKENEQRWYAFDAGGRKFALVQIAGLVARRTVSWITPERVYARGERLGMILFGSEIDTYWPVQVKILVSPGDRVRAGETVIGEWGE